MMQEYPVMRSNRHRRPNLILARLVATFLLMQGWAAVLSDAVTQQHFWNPLHGQFEHLGQSAGLDGLDVDDVDNAAAGIAGHDWCPAEASTCFVPDFVHAGMLTSAGAAFLALPLIPRESGPRPSQPMFAHGSRIHFAPKCSPPSFLPQV